MQPAIYENPRPIPIIDAANATVSPFTSSSTGGLRNEKSPHPVICPMSNDIESCQVGACPTGDGMEGFKTMRWWHVAVLMFAEVISLGILALPSATSKLGLVPGLILIGAFGIIATYTGHTIGRFKLMYPDVQNMADAGSILLGRWGKRVFGVASILFLVFIAAAHVLSFAIMMNVLTGHATCTVGFGFLGAFVSFLCCLVRHLRGVSWISIAALVSVATAVLVTLVGVAKQHPHRSAPAVAFRSDVPFPTAMVAVMDIVMAYSGNVAFFGFLSEMRRPQEYPKALYTIQGTATSLYIFVAASIYSFAGSAVKSPALSSTSHTIRAAAYGVALRTIVVAGVVNGHVAITMVYRSLRPDNATEKGWRAYGLWVAISAVCWTLAWVLSESVPHFDHLIGLVSAVFGSWFTYGISGALWLHMNRSTWREKKIFTLINCGLVAMGGALCVLGTYASLSAIVTHAGGSVWSCADNS